MRAAFALRIISGKNIYNFAFVATLRSAPNASSREGSANAKRHLQCRFLRKRQALRETNPLRLTAFASSP